MNVPNLERLAAEAAQGQQDPWALMVGIQTPNGQQQVPVPIGLFLMLDIVATQLGKIATQLEQLTVQELTK